MADQPESVVLPSMMAELEWVWILAGPGSKARDSILVVEMDERESGRRRRIVPIFESRQDAAKLKLRLCQGRERDYTEQTMRLSEVGSFAARNEVEIMLLDEAGTIVAHLEAKLEQASVH